MSKPNVTVVYQDAPQQTGMGCGEAIASIIVLVGMAAALGWIVWPF